MADEQRTDPSAEVRRLFEEGESRTAKAFEQTVSRGSFGELLAWVTENVVGMMKISTDVFDLMLRNLRLAGRQDVVRLARQLNRAEDKLEMVLQHVELVQEQLARGYDQAQTSGPARVAGNGCGGSGSRTAARKGGEESSAGGRGAQEGR